MLGDAGPLLGDGGEVGGGFGDLVVVLLILKLDVMLELLYCVPLMIQSLLKRLHHIPIPHYLPAQTLQLHLQQAILPLQIPLILIIPQ